VEVAIGGSYKAEGTMLAVVARAAEGETNQHRQGISLGHGTHSVVERTAVTLRLSDSSPPSASDYSTTFY